MNTEILFLLEQITNEFVEAVDSNDILQDTCVDWFKIINHYGLPVEDAKKFIYRDMVIRLNRGFHMKDFQLRSVGIN
jgi:hypothetical protein